MDSNVQRNTTHRESSNAAEKDCDSIFCVSTAHLYDMCPELEERNDNNEPDKVELCAERVMSVRCENSRKLDNDVLEFLHGTRLSASDYLEELSAMKKGKEVVHKRIDDRLSGLNMAPIAILRKGDTS